MRPGFAERLGRGTVLLDGGMGTALIARGLGAGRSPERWNLDRPDDVREIHAAYLTAGSDVVQTNNQGAAQQYTGNTNAPTSDAAFLSPSTTGSIMGVVAVATLGTDNGRWTAVN